MVKIKCRQLRGKKEISEGSPCESVARAFGRIMINPIPPIKRPEKKGTNPGPGSRNDPRWVRQARKHMNNPKIAQRTPSVFRIMTGFQFPLLYKTLFLEKGF
jgi:hypothetical protein